jgi:hypothetical protein
LVASEKVAVIARVDVIRGTAVNDLNTSMVLLKVAEQARAWQSDMRPVLRDDVLRIRLGTDAALT